MWQIIRSGVFFIPQRGREEKHPVIRALAGDRGRVIIREGKRAGSEVEATVRQGGPGPRPVDRKDLMLVRSRLKGENKRKSEKGPFS